MDIIRLTLEDIGVRVDKILLDGDGVWRRVGVNE